MKFLVTALFLVCFAACAKSQKIEFQGGCPAITPMKNFDINKFFGKWYEQRRFFPLYDPLDKCVTYTFFKDFFFYKIDRRRSDIFNPFTSTTGYTTLFSSFDGTVGSLFAIYFFQQYPIPIPYHILETDYTNYAITYSCIDLGIARIQFEFILTRTRYPTDAIIAQAENGFKSQNVSMEGLTKTEQFFCDFNH